MEVLGMLLGFIFWPAAIIAWIVYLRRKKPPRLLRVIGTLFLVGIPLLAALSMSMYMFLDEPLVFAVREGNAREVKSLLERGASPNAFFEGEPALEQAAAEGQEDIVRLLLAHGARTDTRNDWNKQTALQSAQKNGYPEIVKMLRQAGATQ
jgi:hypothetical protein